MIFSMIVLSLALNATWCVATPPEKQFWETKKAYYGSAGLLGMGAAYGVYKLLFNKKRSAALGKFFSRDGGGFFRGLMARLEDPEVKASSRWLAGTLLMAYVSARLAAKGSSLKGSSLPDAASHTAVMARQSEIVQQIAAQNDRMRLAIVEQEQIMKKDQQDLRAKENALADELRREEEAHRERFEQQRHILEAQERKREEDHKHDLEMKQRKIDQLELRNQLAEPQTQRLSGPVEVFSIRSDVPLPQKTIRTQETVEDFQEKLKAFEVSYKPKTENPLADVEYVSGIFDVGSIPSDVRPEQEILTGSSLPDAASRPAVMARQSEIVQQIAAQNDRMRLAIVEQGQIREKYQQHLRDKESALAHKLKGAEEARGKHLEQQRHILEAQERELEEGHKHDLEMKQMKIDQLELRNQLAEPQTQRLSGPVEVVSIRSDVPLPQKTIRTQETVEDFQEKLKAFEVSYKPKTENPLDDVEYVSRILDTSSIQDLDFDPSSTSEEHAEASAYAVLRGCSRYGDVVSIKVAVAESLLSLEHSRLQALRQLKGSSRALRMTTKRGPVLMTDEQIDYRINNVEIVIRELCRKLKKDLPSDVTPDQEISKTVVQKPAELAPRIAVTTAAATRPWGQGASLDDLQTALDAVRDRIFSKRPADGTLTEEYVKDLLKISSQIGMAPFIPTNRTDGLLLDVIRGVNGFAGYKNIPAQNSALLAAHEINLRIRTDLAAAQKDDNLLSLKQSIENWLEENTDDLAELTTSVTRRGLLIAPTT